MTDTKVRTAASTSTDAASTSTAATELGTSRVKRGLAEMLKGGVIMDVVTAEQARIAEDAGAVAVMALERVPADIRSQGGVARMSDPDLIDGIIASVSIPVMAKARIGHFVEAQVLQALGVDYIDESEVLSPADYVEPHRQVALHGSLRLRRDQPRRSAPSHHRGRGHDPLQGRGRHGRRIRGDQAHPHHHRRDQRPEVEVQGRAVRRRQGTAGALRAGRRDRRDGQAPGRAVHRRRGRDAGRRRPHDAARCRRRLRRIRHLQGGRARQARRRDRQGHHLLRRPGGHRRGVARTRRGDGRHQRVRPRRPRTASPSVAGSAEAADGSASSRSRAISASTSPCCGNSERMPCRSGGRASSPRSTAW